MRTFRRSLHATITLAVAFALIAACGGSSSPKPTAAPTATNTAESSNDNSDTASSDRSSGGTPSATKIFDASYTNGSAHVEMSGGASKSADLTKAGGYTLSGATVVSFTDESSQQALSVSSSNNSGDSSGISLTLGGISTAGGFGQECQLTVTKNEASEFAGRIQCTDLNAIQGSTVYDHVNVTATFSAKP